MAQIDRFCLVCNNLLKKEYIHYLTWHKYTCNNRCCQLPPWTKYMATYDDSGDCISAVIIEEIDKKYYALAFSKEKTITTVFSLKSWLGQENGEYHDQFVRKEMCCLNYVVPWHNLSTAREAIIRILKIKAFS